MNIKGAIPYKLGKEDESISIAIMRIIKRGVIRKSHKIIW